MEHTQTHIRLHIFCFVVFDFERQDIICSEAVPRQRRWAKCRATRIQISRPRAFNILSAEQRSAELRLLQLSMTHTPEAIFKPTAGEKYSWPC